MKFVFVDEQYAKDTRGNFTSITATVFDSESMIEYRGKLIDGLISILHSDKSDQTIVASLPVLHASHCPEGVSGDQQLEIFSLIFSIVKEINVRVIRFGYYNKSMFYLKSQAQYVDFCLFNLLFAVNNRYSDDFIYVFEYNKSIHHLLKSYNDADFQAMCRQAPNISSIRSMDRILGRFYCDKKNYFMYAADYCSYALYLNDKKDSSDYNKSILNKLGALENQIEVNQIIWMNDATIKED
jgi:hypothetical protein